MPVSSTFSGVFTDTGRWRSGFEAEVFAAPFARAGAFRRARRFAIVPPRICFRRTLGASTSTSLVLLTRVSAIPEGCTKANQMPPWEDKSCSDQIQESPAGRGFSWNGIEGGQLAFVTSAA